MVRLLAFAELRLQPSETDLLWHPLGGLRVFRLKIVFSSSSRERKRRTSTQKMQSPTLEGQAGGSASRSMKCLSNRPTSVPYMFHKSLVITGDT